MKKTLTLFVGVLAAHVAASTVQAAFIIEPRTPGKAFDNYSYLGGAASPATTDSAAVGLTSGNGSVFGGNAAADVYVFEYNLGTDVDNTVFAPGLNLGNGDLATGLVGGLSGTYRVFVTWPTSTNIDPDGSDFSLINTASPGSPLLTVNDVIQDGDTPGVSPGADAWFLLGSVSLTSGQSYELRVTANDPSFVSQRMDGVMFEIVPEPSTVALGLIGGAGLMVGYLRRRAKK